MTVFPQVLVNVRDVDRTKAANDEGVAQAIAQAEHTLNGNGRVLVRASGTEPLVRVMVEAADEETAQQLADDIATVVQQRLSS
jgi:phosphoglucosamine mutase